MNRLKYFILFLTVSMSYNGIAENGSWVLEKDESGIKVYTRTIEGESIREFKALTTITASRKSIAQIIVNINDYANWYPDISEAEIIKKVGPGEYYVYNVLDLPWPATDRDGVSKMTIVKSEGTTIIKMHSVDGVKAENDDYVRITKSYGFWKLKTIGAKTSVHFQYFASPGGSLPDWIINMFIVDNPFQTITLLKEKVTA
ncbi:MAG: hypothetical protein GQ574_26480 [Crocinitomix sp.]|nr:hypothetical protein [Crocinitomix sp.]